MNKTLLKKIISVNPRNLWLKIMFVVFVMFVVNIVLAANYYIESPYAAEDLRGIQYAQLNDIMYLVHSDYQVRKLSRYADNNWTIEAVDFEDGPFLAVNDTTTTITPAGTLTAGGTVTLTASGNVFDADHVGSIWKIDQKRGSQTFQGKIDADESGTATYYFEGTFSFITEGTFEGTVTLERSENGTDWTSALTPLTDRNYENPGENEDHGAFYRVTGSDWTSGACNWTITITDNYQHGTVKVTAFTSATVVTGTVVEPLYAATATAQWYEPSFSDYRGWPRAICFYQQRLVLAGTEYEPTTIWTSRSFDYENFDVGQGLDNQAVYYNITIAKQNPILWLHDLDAVVVGTNGGVFKWGAMDAGQTLTPANPSVKRVSGYGVDPIQPAFIAESLLFVERGGHKVNELAYKLEADGHVVTDLTLLATHIAADSAIAETAVMMRPTPILWCVRADGVLLGLSYQKQQGVIAWHRHITDGLVKSVAVIPGVDEDELWMVIERTINGSAVRYVERLKPFDWGDDQNDCWFVDCGLKYTGAATATLTGLSHLEGETVQVFYGTGYQTKTVTAGQITGLSPTVTEATVGLPYTSMLETMPLEIQTQTGFTIGKKKRVVNTFVAFEDSMKFEYSESTKEQYWPVTFEDRTDILMPTTGYRPMLSLTGISSEQVSVILRQQWPYPLKVLAIYPTVE